MVYGKYRPNDPHGGVFLLANTSLITTEESSLDIDRSELVNTAGNKDLLLCSFNRPTLRKFLGLEYINGSLSESLTQIQIYGWAGNFNLHHINWESDFVALCSPKIFTLNSSIYRITIP